MSWASEEWFKEGRHVRRQFPLPSQISKTSLLNGALRDLSICVGVGEGWVTQTRASTPLSGPPLSPTAPLDCEVLQAKAGCILFVPPLSLLPQYQLHKCLVSISGINE